MLTVYIGSTFKLTGTLQQDGALADFTGWSLTAALNDAAGTTVIAPLSMVWLDATQGLFYLMAPSTSTWTAMKARIDMRLVTPQGDVILGPPAYLRIAQSPLS